MMEIKLLESDSKNNKTSFILSKTTPSFANTIRRTVLEEVPVMAIEDVEFKQNSSILYDEIIAHRLGLLPLKTDLKSYNLPSKCKCKGAGCARCQLKLSLKSKGDMVYASDIVSKDPKIKPVYPNTPIVKLLKGQKVELEATACLGQGKEHAKWSPGLVFYKYKPIIEIGKNIKHPDAIVKSCPVGVFEIKGNRLVINDKNLFKCHLCQNCTDICPAIKLTESENDFVFYVESWGQLSCKEMLVTAANILQEKLNEFNTKLKELK